MSTGGNISLERYDFPVLVWNGGGKNSNMTGNSSNAASGNNQATGTMGTTAAVNIG